MSNNKKLIVNFLTALKPYALSSFGISANGEITQQKKCSSYKHYKQREGYKT